MNMKYLLHHGNPTTELIVTDKDKKTRGYIFIREDSTIIETEPFHSSVSSYHITTAEDGWGWVSREELVQYLINRYAKEAGK